VGAYAPSAEQSPRWPAARVVAVVLLVLLAVASLLMALNIRDSADLVAATKRCTAGGTMRMCEDPNEPFVLGAVSTLCAGAALAVTLLGRLNKRIERPHS
jgi:hypothetical protein